MLNLYRNALVMLILFVFFAPQPVFMVTHGGSLTPLGSGVELQKYLTDASGSVVSQVATLLVFANAILLAKLYRLPVQRIYIAVLPILPLLIWAIVSFAWSDYPILTARRSFRLLIEILSTVMIASTFEKNKELLRLMFQVFFLIVILDALAVFVPSVSMPGNGYAGIHLYKNETGLFYFLAIPIFALGILDRSISRSRLGATVALLIGSAVFVATRDKTALVCVPVCALLAVFPWIAARSNTQAKLALPIIAALLAAFAGLLVIAVGLPDVLQTLFGDATLTGRVGLWRYMFTRFDSAPIVGIGYGALWQTGPDVQRQTIGYAVFLANEGHNGYLDILTQLGLVGAALLAFYLWRTFVRILRSIIRPEARSSISISLYAFYVFVGCAIIDVTESLYFRPGIYIFLTLILISTAVIPRIPNSGRTSRNSGTLHHRGASVVARTVSH